MYKLNVFFGRHNFIIIPAFMILVLIYLLKSSHYSPFLANSIALDFLIIIPSTYFLLIRKTNINKITIVSVFVLGLVLSSLFIPKEHQEVVSFAKNYMLPILEIGVVSYLFYKARRVYLEFKKERSNQDFSDAIKMACKEILPARVAHFLATEIAVIYYAFFSWKSVKLKSNDYSYHKEGTYNGTFLGIILVLIVETFVLHMILTKMNVGIAVHFIIGILGGYTLLQIVALFKSISKRPIYYDKENRKIILRFGFIGQADINIENIEKIELSSKDFEGENSNHFSFLGSFCTHNTIMYFKEPIEYEFFYGIKRKTKVLGLIIDKKTEFSSILEDE